MAPPRGSAALAAALGTAAVAAAQPSNVLLLMADQFRADALNPTTAPHLWALSQEGLRFDAFYSSTPTCTPARAALLTGRSPWGHGMLGYGIVAPQYPFEMPPYLASLGYDTAVVGKNHFWTADGENASTVPHHGYGYSALYDGLGDGMHASTGELDTYDEWFAQQTGGKNPLASCGLDWNSWRGCASGYEYDEALHPTAWVGATARAWLRARRQRLAAEAAAAAPDAPSPKPFFLKVSFHRPHSPYDPPQRLYNATPATLPPPVVAADGWDANFTTNGRFCGPDGADAWCGTMPEPAATVARRSYLASLAFVDETVGALLGDVNRSDTWVIFLSDHGDGQGDHGLWRKGYPWELSARVPGAIVWPTGYDAAVPRGSATEELAEVRDVFPTVAALAGGWPLPAGRVVEGAPLTCLVGGPAAPAECAAFAAASPLLRPPPGSTQAAAAPAPAGAAAFAWRSSLDLEHDVVYNASIHWNALVGAGRTAAAPAGHRIKYIFLALYGAEQLFDVTADPTETADLAAHPAWAGELAAWRSAMAAQFTSEGRGPAWVTPDGQLLPRPAGQLCSPNYPPAYSRQYC
jgi:arylsulfatase